MSQPTVQYEKNAELFADYQTPYKLNRPILAPSGEPGDFDALGVDNMRISATKAGSMQLTSDSTESDIRPRSPSPTT